MVAQEGFRRLNRISLYLAGCSLAGVIIWSIEVFSVGRWGLGDLIYLASLPLVASLGLRIISWVLEGFWQNPQDPPDSSGPDR